MPAGAVKVGAATTVCAVVLVIAVLFFASSVLVPVVVALLCAVLLDPAVMSFERRGLSRSFSSVLVIAGSLTLSVMTGWISYKSFSRVVEQTPQYVQKLDEFRAAFTKRTDIITHQVRPAEIAPPDSGSVQKVEVVDSFSSWQGLFIKFLGSAFELISLAFFVPLLIFYLLVGKENLIESLNNVAGKYWYLPKTNSEIPKMIRTFFKGNFLGGVTLVILHFALFLDLGLPNSAGLALASGPLNLIPILGAPIAILLPLAQGIVQWKISDPLPFIVLAGFLFTFHVLVGNLLIPQLVGSRINVNPAAIIIGLLFWGWIWGAMGFLLAIPLTAALKIVLESNEKTHPISNLMAARPRYVIPLRHRRMTPVSELPPAKDQITAS